MATVAEHLATNIHLTDAPDRATFHQRRDSRVATLALLKLMLSALQIKLRGGRAPNAEDNGRRYLKIPMDQFEER